MDVTFVCSREEPFKMEVGFFDTVQDMKQKLQSCRGWRASTMSLLHNANVLAEVDGDGDSGTERYGIVEGSVIHVVLLDSQQRQQKRKGPNKGRDEGAPPLRVTVVSWCGAGRVEVPVGARAAVSALREELERARGAASGNRFPLPRDGAYFFIHRQSVMDVPVARRGLRR
ncbi:uncharacterized protein LOC133897187 [Phragmites australis]|uniref:uncharacterized protein LOC133897187 n=1 Tax=Phragmites australis TaxID=29695 RepID=UPI002D79BAB5|nr:uncharacterized protein LOC133897187 [Phragmites australis]